MSVEFAVSGPGRSDEEVNADNVRVLSGGVLAFFEDGSLSVAYAPGAWTLVTVVA